MGRYSTARRNDLKNLIEDAKTIKKLRKARYVGLPLIIRYNKQHNLFMLNRSNSLNDYNNDNGENTLRHMSFIRNQTLKSFIYRNSGLNSFIVDTNIRHGKLRGDK